MHKAGSGLPVILFAFSSSSVSQVADYLEADTRPWAARFCKQLTKASKQAEEAWELLSSSGDHFTDTVLAAHGLFSPPASSLAEQLQLLPACMHEYACRRQVSTSEPDECLTLHAKDESDPVFLLADVLPKLVDVAALAISHFGRASSSWHAVGAAVSAAPQLTRLSLSHGVLTEDGVDAVLTAARRGAPTAHLSLSGCCVRGRAAAALAAHLPSLSTLQSLELRSNGLHDAGITDVAATLRNLPELTALDLSSTQIGNGGASVLAPHVGACGALRRLDLSVNNINATGMQALAPQLARLTRLTSLNLCWNSIGSGGAQVCTVASLTARLVVMSLVAPLVVMSSWQPRLAVMSLIARLVVMSFMARL